MAYSSVTIEFTRMPAIGETIDFYEDNRAWVFFQKFKTQRLGPNETKIPIFHPNPDRYLGFISVNFKDAINLDVNSSNIFTVEWFNGPANSGLGTVKITANYPNAEFILGSENTSGAIITINNDSVPIFNISDLHFEEASSSKCQNIKVSVMTSVLSSDVLEPMAIAGNTQNPLTFDFLRGQAFNLRLRSATGSIISRTVITAALLNAANFSLTINNSPNGATVIVNNINSDGLEINYSLDNVAWQASNVYSGLGVDNYVLHVKDQFGCSFEKTFSITDNAIYNPHFKISKSNPIRFAQRVVWGDSANYKTDENTLSCEADVRLPYTEVQYFQSADVVTTQFQSNYSTNIVKVIKQDKSETSIPVVKKSQNIGVREKLDAFQYNLGNGKTGIYFLSGNRYDFDTNVILEPFSLNGYLPYWGKPGNYINVGSAWFLIEETIYDEQKNVEVIVINSIYNGIDLQIVAGCIFNFKNFEVYEAAIDMLQYLNQDIRVKIESADPKFNTVIYLSEIINVKVRQPLTVEIRYRNTTNTDIYYSTGIEFKIRQEISKIGGLNDQKSDVYKTDTNAVLLNADVYEGDEFTFEPVTKEIMRKLLLALSHEVLFINEVGYVKNDNIDVEGPLEDTNLYVVKAKMIKNGNVYNSQTSGSGNEIYNGESLQVPGLVDFGGGFVRY